jgi:hypothetical protein
LPTQTGKRKAAAKKAPKAAQKKKAKAAPKKKPAAKNKTGVDQKRKPNFTKTEDLVICKAFVYVSENPIIGNDQKCIWCILAQG